MIGRRHTTLLAAAVVFFSSVASAQPGGPGTAKFDEGVKAFEKGNYPVAVEAFREAYELSKGAKYLWNLALAEIKAERPFDALGHLRTYVKSAEATPQNVERANQLIERVNRQVGHLAITAPSGADVSVDGVSVGKAPLDAVVDVDPGKAHVVEARQGARAAHENVPAPGPTLAEVKLAFAEPPAAVPAAAAPAIGAAPMGPPSETGPVHHRAEGWFVTTLLLEMTASATCAGIGTAVFLDGHTNNDSGKQLIGGAFWVGSAVLAGAYIVTLRKWPQADDPPSKASARSARITPTATPSFAGVSLSGAF